LSPRVPVGNGAAGDLRAAEARTVAAFLKRIVAEGWAVWDRQNGQKRKIGYGDVGILFRAKEAMDLYEEEFRDFEIPYRVAGGRRYYSRQEMGALLAVLSAIDNPKDKVALTAALRSVFFSASDEELFLFTSRGHALDYLEAGRKNAGGAKSIQQAFRLMRELHNLRNEMPVPLFILKLYQTTRILPFLYLKPQGDQKVANLFKIVDMSRALARQGLVTLRSFVQFLRKMESAEAEEGESPLAEESENVARLMTIHKAKGLEFPLVILGDAAYQSRSRVGEGIVNREAGHLEMRLGNRTVNIATRGWEAAGEKEKLREAAEDARLLYVAATRARDYLVIPLVPGDKKRFLGPLWGSLETADDIRWGQELTPFGHTGPAGFRAWEQALEEIHRCGEKGERAIAASALAEKSEEPKIGKSWNRGRGALFGSFVHELFYHVELRHPKALEIMARTLGKKYGLADDETMRGVELVQWGLTADVLKRAALSQRVWRELPFVYNHRGSLIEGFVDLAFEENGEIVVVDFKTDEVEGKELEKRTRRYAPQGVVYAMALEKIARKRVKEVVFLFLSARIEKSTPLGKSAFHRVEKLLDESMVERL
ncbi:MAG: PD-(D/E)XK nuclease family protein, partial [Deltaproteobacteria bacterium]|nr:PD-(D/E)XK nuclease family protein [Deltaproteobacteria bacterium]